MSLLVYLLLWRVCLSSISCGNHTCQPCYRVSLSVTSHGGPSCLSGPEVTWPRCCTWESSDHTSDNFLSSVGACGHPPLVLTVLTLPGTTTRLLHQFCQRSGPQLPCSPRVAYPHIHLQWTKYIENLVFSTNVAVDVRCGNGWGKPAGRWLLRPQQQLTTVGVARLTFQWVATLRLYLF